MTPIPGSARASRAGRGLVVACLGAALASAWAPADARVYDPFQVPKARYVAPLAPWPAASYRSKDFAIHKKGAYYHLFYTRVRRHLPYHWNNGSTVILNETTFGHAISSDLENWFEADTVLTVSRDTTRWDAHHLWAPTLFEHQDTTWMYFTGVRDRRESSWPGGWIPRWQVMGAAYSTDPLLLQWTRLPDPLWAPCPEFGLPGVDWALCNPTLPERSADFRDPFVLAPEPGSGDPWLMYFNARPRIDQYNYVVGVALANDPRGPWEDMGALWDTYYPPVNSKVESPHVFRRGPDWHLMFSGDDNTTGIAWHSGSSPYGPWSTRPSLNIFLKDMKDHPYEFALEPEAWYASEHFTEETPSGTAEYLAVVHSYDAPPEYNPPPPAPGEDISIVEFRRMQWDAQGYEFVLLGPNPVRTMTVTDDTVTPGQAIELVLLSDGGDGRTADLAASIVVGGQAVPVDPLQLGLPRTIPLRDPETRLPWTVRATNLVPPFEASVWIASQPLRAGTHFTVGSGGTTDVDPIVRRPPGPGLRAAAGNPFSLSGGAGASLELSLAVAGDAHVALYDARGRQVRVLVDGDEMPAGERTLRWDGRDDAGRTVDAGLYFARAVTSSGARTVRLLALP